MEGVVKHCLVEYSTTYGHTLVVKDMLVSLKVRKVFLRNKVAPRISLFVLDSFSVKDFFIGEIMKTTQKIVFSALFSALTCVATMLIKIPSPMQGYLNLGDCVVLLSAWLLPPVYGFCSAGLGSMLADLFSGYATYAPATFIIKGVMALIAHFGFKLLSKRLKSIVSQIISGAIAEIFMVLGYLAFESCLYGFVPSLVNVLPNGCQGLAGLVLGVLLIKIFEKNKIILK